MKPVIDSNIVIHGRTDSSLMNSYTVPEVLEELESKEAERQGDLLKLDLKEPGESELEKVEEISDSINSPTSETDEKLVALALTLDTLLITDDRSMQNLASKLDVKFEGYLDEEIETELEWYFRCSNCGGEVPNSDRCPRCGSQEVVRKVR